MAESHVSTGEPLDLAAQVAKVSNAFDKRIAGAKGSAADPQSALVRACRAVDPAALMVADYLQFAQLKIDHDHGRRFDATY
jgi:hypothetical protein